MKNIKWYKILIFYNQLFRFWYKPRVAFFFVPLTLYTLLGHSFFCHITFGLIFVFFFIYFVSVLFYKYSLDKEKKFIEPKSEYYKIHILHCGVKEDFLFSTIKTFVQPVATATKSTVFATSAAIVTGIVVEEVVVHQNHNAKSDVIRDTYLEQAAYFDKVNMPDNAMHQKNLAHWEKADNMARVPGGIIAQNLDKILDFEVNHDHLKKREESLQDTSQRAKTETKEAEQRRQFEMVHYKQNLERESEISNKYQEREDRKEEWQNKSLLEKTQSHVEHLINTVNLIPGGTDATKAIVHKMSEVVVRRVEIQTDTVCHFHEKHPLLPHISNPLDGIYDPRTKNFRNFDPDNNSKIEQFFVEDGDSKEDKIPALHDSPWKNLAPGKPSLEHAYPFTPERLEEISSILADLDKNKK